MHARAAHSTRPLTKNESRPRLTTNPTNCKNHNWNPNNITSVIIIMIIKKNNIDNNIGSALNHVRPCGHAAQTFQPCRAHAAHVCARIYAHIYAHIHAHPHAHTYGICLYTTHMSICMSMPMSIHLIMSISYAHIYTMHIHMSMHTKTSLARA